jgi:hypothetical protein
VVVAVAVAVAVRNQVKVLEKVQNKTVIKAMTAVHKVAAVGTVVNKSYPN